MLFFLILLVIVAFYLQQKMGIYALKYLHEELSVDTQLVDPGQPVTMTVTLENRSRLPILYLRVSVTLPEETRILDSKDLTKPGYISSQYSYACYLLPGQRLETGVKLSFPRRGVWHLGSIYLAAGDLLGIKEDGSRREAHTLVVAAPAPVDGLDAIAVVGGLMGDQSVRRWIHEDPILSAGYREYTGREPQRSIAWGRSLSSGQMMVRCFDHTTDRRVRVILLMQRDLPLGRQEALFSTVRSLCDRLEEESIPYSFAGNGALYSFLGTSMEKTENGLGYNHRNLIMDCLGRAGYGTRSSAEQLIRKELAASDPVQGYLLVVAEDNEDIQSMARTLELRTEAPVHVVEAPHASPEEEADHERK